MLSRTADSLFWLSRYVERADYLARVLEAASRLSALPKAYGSGGNEWESALATAGCIDAFHQVYETPDAATVIDFLAFSEQNPSSIRRCLETARTNARAVRTAITTVRTAGKAIATQIDHSGSSMGGNGCLYSCLGTALAIFVCSGCSGVISALYYFVYLG